MIRHPEHGRHMPKPHPHNRPPSNPSIAILLALLLSLAPSCTSRERPALAPHATVPGRQATTVVAWKESFDRPQLDWITPIASQAALVSQVFSLETDLHDHFLHARHDARPLVDSPPPAVHYGKSFAQAPVAVDQVRRLRWKWRVHHHPSSTNDPWRDLAASVYVIVRMPGLLPGRGFKFGWVSAPAPTDTRQRGIVQIPMRAGLPLDSWVQENVDLCDLYKQHYGPCEGESILYIGVVTDADDTRSEAEADYADFELEVVERASP